MSKRLVSAAMLSLLVLAWTMPINSDEVAPFAGSPTSGALSADNSGGVYYPLVIQEIQKLSKKIADEIPRESTCNNMQAKPCQDAGAAGACR